MKLFAHEQLSYRFALILSGSLVCMSGQSEASEGQYDELFSSRYTALTGLDLSEEGVRQALEQFDQLNPQTMEATIAVVGEQKYKELTPYLKDIYNRRTDEAPSKSVAHLYSVDWVLDGFRTLVARALVRCGDPDGEQYAIEQALNSPNMSLVPALYAIRTLKYLVHHNGTDVSAELEFLTEIDSDDEMLQVPLRAARELVEIRRYLQLKTDSTASIYTDALERVKENGDSRLRRFAPTAIRAYGDSRLRRRLEGLEGEDEPSWKESFKLFDAQR